MYNTCYNYILFTSTFFFSANSITEALLVRFVNINQGFRVKGFHIIIRVVRFRSKIISCVDAEA